MVIITKKIALAALAGALMLSGCNNANESNPRNERNKMMIAQSKLVRDAHSYALPNEARVTHLNWDAEVDFVNKTIRAIANYNIQNLTQTSKIIFDIKGLRIENVKVDGSPVTFEIGEEKPFIGAPLSIPIQADSKVVSIEYVTSPGAEALLWVEGEKPFLFTQSQAILARTWIPCQDSPGIRLTYDAKVTVPSDLLALMSAENPQQKNDTGVYTFRMDQPIPSYLIALAVGDIAFKPIGERTGVYAIPSLVEAAAKEFEDMQMMLEAAEKLYGNYAWGRYDVLVLPPAFPFGGMENPRLTFATPTILAGDKSLVSLIAHELAHSWSGNLVTNATWDDFWLNEGFTVYFEERIMEDVYGREFSEMLAQLSKEELYNTVEDLSQSNDRDTWLKLNLEGRSPDDGMTDIAYNKGYFFLRLIEETVGREKWDVFLKDYFTTNAFKVMDTESFLSHLKKSFATEKITDRINIDEWVYQPGIPKNIPVVNSEKMEQVLATAGRYMKGEIKENTLNWNKWSYQEKVHFINALSNVDANQMAKLDRSFNITQSTNNEVLFAWLMLSVKKNYTPSYAKMEQFLIEVGRRKFVAPLYEELVKTNQKALAEKIYGKARGNYHAVTIETVDNIMR